MISYHFPNWLCFLLFTCRSLVSYLIFCLPFLCICCIRSSQLMVAAVQLILRTSIAWVTNHTTIIIQITRDNVDTVTHALRFSLPSRVTILYFVYISYICLLDLFFFHNQCIIPNMFQPHAQLFLDFAKIEDHSGSLEVKSHNETSHSPILSITIYQYGRHMPIPKRASIFYTWLRIATSFPTTPSITHLMIESKPF